MKRIIIIFVSLLACLACAVFIAGYIKIGEIKRAVEENQPPEIAVAFTENGRDVCPNSADVGQTTDYLFNLHKQKPSYLNQFALKEGHYAWHLTQKDSQFMKFQLTLQNISNEPIKVLPLEKSARLIEKVGWDDCQNIIVVSQQISPEWKNGVDFCVAELEPGSSKFYDINFEGVLPSDTCFVVYMINEYILTKLDDDHAFIMHEAPGKEVLSTNTIIALKERLN